jgi:threonyl-tRNA synthetase
LASAPRLGRGGRRFESGQPDSCDTGAGLPLWLPDGAVIREELQRSYRDLPVRLNELAAMFRAERSGVLSGLSRVRQINLDDTHVFCRPDQIADEVGRALRSALRAQEILGLPVDYVRLSRRDDSPVYLGAPEQWEAAEAALRAAAAAGGLAGLGLSLVDAPGEAAFYGPKLSTCRCETAGGRSAPGCAQAASAATT